MYCIPYLHVSSLLSNEIVIGFIRRRRKNSERKNTQLKKHAVALLIMQGTVDFSLD